MFSNLEEQIEKAHGHATNPTTRVLRFLGVLGLTAVLFGSLYLGILLLG